MSYFGEADDTDLAAAVEDLPSFRQGGQFDEAGGHGDGGDTAGAGSSSYNVPDLTKSFVQQLHRAVKEQNVSEIHSLYENTFNKLTERFFKSSPWPPVEAIAGFCDNDDVFMTLYQELYYRHIYAKLQPTIAQRFESWHNYCDLFNYILNAKGPVHLELPNQWLWDIIDEFIYQFQAFLQYRCKLKNKSRDELEMLSQNRQIWEVHQVLTVLQTLVTKSKIVELLNAQSATGEPLPPTYPAGHAPTDDSYDASSCNLYRMLGYFSLVGLLRVHSLLGDFHLALRTIDPIDLSKKGLFARVTACHITLYYYLGFAYMVQRRYVDAIKCFTSTLVYISRTKQFHTRSYQYEFILKKNEQMYALLALCLALCPQRVDENVHTTVREKHGDKILRIQRGDEVYEELFQFACPKFLTPSLPNYAETPLVNHSQDAYRLMLAQFRREVQQQTLNPMIRSYLKLYTTISVSKLSKFLDVDEETLMTYLMCYKHKNKALVWQPGDVAAAGTPTSASDVSFFVVGDMVHIAETKVERRYGDFFLRHIAKFEEIIRDVSKENDGTALERHAGDTQGHRRGNKDKDGNKQHGKPIASKH